MSASNHIIVIFDFILKYMKRIFGDFKIF